MKSLVILMFFGTLLAPAAATSASPHPSVTQEAPARAAATELIDLNAATPVELEALPGIGPAMARRIVEHREKNGPFVKLEEILESAGSCPFLLRECDS